MLSRLHLQDHYNAQNRQNTCVVASGERHALALSDDNQGKGYEFNDPYLGIQRFSTAEHYRDFQRLSPMAKLKYFTSRNGVINAEASDLNPNWDHDAVLMQINATKYAQSVDFKNYIDDAIALGKELNDGAGAVVILNDSQANSYGESGNYIGNSQTAFANLVASNQVELSTKTPALKSDTAMHSTELVKATNQFKDFESTLLAIRRKAGQDQGRMPGEFHEYTSDLGEDYVKRFGPRPVLGSMTASSATSSPQIPQEPGPLNRTANDAITISSKQMHVKEIKAFFEDFKNRESEGKSQEYRDKYQATENPDGSLTMSFPNAEKEMEFLKELATKTNFIITDGKGGVLAHASGGTLFSADGNEFQEGETLRSRAPAQNQYKG